MLLVEWTMGLETCEKLAKASLVNRSVSLPVLFENEADLLARMQRHQRDLRPIEVLFALEETDKTVESIWSWDTSSGRGIRRFMNHDFPETG